jgi:peptide/nickel transport system substrate-binding protein
MEGQGDKPLPESTPKKGMSTKMLAIIVVVLLLVVAVVGVVILAGGNKAPTAKVTANKTVLTAGETVSFNASQSSDPEGKSLTYIWQFGDGTFVNTTTAIVDHTFVYPGKYMTLLTVKDPSGATGSNFDSILRIEVLNPTVTTPSNNSSPYALTAASSDSVATGASVQFNANSSYAYSIGDEGDQSSACISILSWTFGDGSAAESGNFSANSVGNHIYSGNKVIYNSYLTVTSNHSAVQRYYYSIMVGGSTGGVKNPDTFISVTIGEPDVLDPAVDYETAGGEILQNVYETLVWYEGESASILKPMLATAVPTVANGGISEDGLTYTFNLRSNVKFHNGETMTSADVVYSIKRLLMINDPNGPAWILGQVLVQNYYDHPWVPASEVAKGVWAKDSMTVQFNLTSPYPAFLYCMAYTEASVVSMKYVEENGGIVGGEQNEWMNTHTCGTGPYELIEWAPNQQILMKRNDNYWQEPAVLKYVIIKKANDYGTRLLMLQAGDADAAYIGRQHASDVETDSRFRIVKDKPGFSLDFLGLNQNIVMAKNPAKDLDTITPTFFADRNVRLAFAHSFNYTEYIDTIFLGAAVQPNGIIPAGMFAYNATVPVYDFNLQKAADYLNAAPSDVVGESWGQKGFKITLMYNAGNQAREAACTILRDGLNALTQNGLVVGDIQVSIMALDWPAYLATLQGKGLPAFFLGWAPDYADPDDYTNPFLHSSGTYAARCSINNATLTALVVEAAMELNTDLRIQMYKTISDAVYDNCYYIWTAQATSFHVERTWVQGYYNNPMYSGYYYYEFSKSA